MSRYVRCCIVRAHTAEVIILLCSIIHLFVLRLHNHPSQHFHSNRQFIFMLGWSLSSLLSASVCKQGWNCTSYWLHSLRGSYLWWLETENCGWIGGSCSWNSASKRRSQVWVLSLGSFSSVATALPSWEVSDLYKWFYSCYLHIRAYLVPPI